MQSCRFLSLMPTQANTNVILDPPLSGIREIQLLGYHYKKVKPANPMNPLSKDEHIPVENVFIYCDLVDSMGSYSLRTQQSGGVMKLNPSNLLAVIDSQKYPCLRVKPLSAPVHSFNLRIATAKGADVTISEDDIVRIDLRIT